MHEKKFNIRVMVKYLLLISAFILGILYFRQVLYFLQRLWGILFPLILGAAIAYILNLIVRRLEKLYFPHAKKKFFLLTRRPICIALSLVLILGILVLIVTMIVPELIGALGIIGQGIAIAFEQVRAWVIERADLFPSIAEYLENLKIDWPGTIQSIADFAIGGVGDLLSYTVTFVGALVGGIVNLVIAVIFAVYILANKEMLCNGTNKLLSVYGKPKTAEWLKKVGDTANRTFSSFIVGQCTEAVILGVLCTLGMWIFRFPYAPMIGAFIGVTALVPIVGAYLGAGVGALMILTVDPNKVLWFILFVIILQQIEGNLIYPRVVGSSIGLPGMWVLAAVTVGGGLGGIFGMLIGVPIAATIYKLIKADVEIRSLKMKKRSFLAQYKNRRERK